MYQKSWSYAIFFVRYMVDDGWNGYFWFSAILCPFAPLTALRKYVVCDGCNCYFSFWAIFCPFTTLTAPKIKIKKKKNHLEISWSYAILFLRYMVCDGCNCYFSFWAILFPFTALTAQKIKISKNHKKQQIKQTTKKIPRDIKLHMCTKDYD